MEKFIRQFHLSLSGDQVCIRKILQGWSPVLRCLYSHFSPFAGLPPPDVPGPGSGREWGAGAGASGAPGASGAVTSDQRGPGAASVKHMFWCPAKRYSETKCHHTLWWVVMYYSLPFSTHKSERSNGCKYPVVLTSCFISISINLVSCLHDVSFFHNKCYRVIFQHSIFGWRCILNSSPKTIYTCNLKSKVTEHSKHSIGRTVLSHTSLTSEPFQSISDDSSLKQSHKSPFFFPAFLKIHFGHGHSDCHKQAASSNLVFCLMHKHRRPFHSG